MWHYWYTYHWNNLWQLLHTCIAWSSKVIYIRILDLKVNRLWFKKPEHNITNHLFTTNLRFWKRENTPYHWYWKILLSRTYNNMYPILRIMIYFNCSFRNPVLVSCMLFFLRNPFWFCVCYSSSRIREVTSM